MDVIAAILSQKKACQCIMGHSKKKIKQQGKIISREVRLEYHPEKRKIRQAENPDSFYEQHPKWSFCKCDTWGRWAITEEKLGNRLWDDIFPKLRNFESMTWKNILIDAKKQHHGQEVASLNKCARDRIHELNIDYETIYSLRIDGTTRIYGFLDIGTFILLWFDDDHGDNDTCVCRSHKKHS